MPKTPPLSTILDPIAGERPGCNGNSIQRTCDWNESVERKGWVWIYGFAQYPGSGTSALEGASLSVKNTW